MDYCNERNEKGKSLLSLPNDFVVIDLETTGLSSKYDLILELSAIRVKNGNAEEDFSSLVKYHDDQEVYEYITELTGITTDMIREAPHIDDVFPQFIDFVGDSVVVGHNVNFDVNFIYDEMMSRYDKPFKNDFIDTMRLSRRLHPEYPHHRLCDLCVRYCIDQDIEHRALADCESTLKCYKALENDINESYGGIEEFKKTFARKKHGIHATDITSSGEKQNPSCPLFGKICVITGKLDRFTRKEAMQLIADIGGINTDSVTKKTNYLILGNNDYCASIKDGKSNKQKKAEELKMKGFDIEVIPEDVFYELTTSE